ncbi:MAG: hypothetical protein GF363_11070 [Chitinivibrionales bacterium]|nr:hypothetical protein [Chitinivibrionales bacterium]
MSNSVLWFDRLRPVRLLTKIAAVIVDTGHPPRMKCEHGSIRPLLKDKLLRCLLEPL